MNEANFALTRTRLKRKWKRAEKTGSTTNKSPHKKLLNKRKIPLRKAQENLQPILQKIDYEFSSIPCFKSHSLCDKST